MQLIPSESPSAADDWTTIGERTNALAPARWLLSPHPPLAGGGAIPWALERSLGGTYEHFTSARLWRSRR